MKTCKNNCAFAKDTKHTTDSGHQFRCYSKEAAKMFAKEEDREYDAKATFIYVFDVSELQNRECPCYKQKKITPEQVRRRLYDDLVHLEAAYINDDRQLLEESIEWLQSLYADIEGKPIQEVAEKIESEGAEQALIISDAIAKIITCQCECPFFEKNEQGEMICINCKKKQN